VRASEIIGQRRSGRPIGLTGLFGCGGCTGRIIGMGAIFGNVGNCGSPVTTSGRVGAIVGAFTTGGNDTLGVVVGPTTLGVVVGT